MNVIRYAALLMAAVFVFGACACSESNVSQRQQDSAGLESAETAPEDTRVYPELPDMDCEGYKFNMVHWIISGWTMLTDLDAGEMDGEIINDAVYKRNRTIEDRYNISITGEYVDDNQLIDTCKRAVQAGDNAYDVYYPRTYESTQLVSAGVLLEFTHSADRGTTVPPFGYIV